MAVRARGIPGGGVEAEGRCLAGGEGTVQTSAIRNPISRFLVSGSILFPSVKEAKPQAKCASYIVIHRCLYATSITFRAATLEY